MVARKKIKCKKDPPFQQAYGIRDDVIAKWNIKMTISWNQQRILSILPAPEAMSVK